MFPHQQVNHNFIWDIGPVAQVVGEAIKFRDHRSQLGNGESSGFELLKGRQLLGRRNYEIHYFLVHAEVHELYAQLVLDLGLFFYRLLNHHTLQNKK